MLTSHRRCLEKTYVSSQSHWSKCEFISFVCSYLYKILTYTHTEREGNRLVKSKKPEGESIFLKKVEMVSTEWTETRRFVNFLVWRSFCCVDLKDCLKDISFSLFWSAFDAEQIQRKTYYVTYKSKRFLIQNIWESPTSVCALVWIYETTGGVKMFICSFVHHPLPYWQIHELRTHFSNILRTKRHNHQNHLNHHPPHIERMRAWWNIKQLVGLAFESRQFSVR